MYVYTAICGAWLIRRLIHRKDFQVTQSISGASAPRGRAPRAFGATLLALLLTACGGGDPKPAAAGGGAPPPPEVAVVTVEPKTTPLVTELPGRVEASRVAQVRARVNGIVLKRLFREGSEVKAGQLLFQIDPAPYQAAVDSAKAVLAKAQANVVQANELATRFKPLADAKAISAQEYVDAQAAQAQAQADVAAANAALRTAQLNLGYASVTAPISGRIGRALVTEGALVSAAEATQMALIQQIDPVYVNSTQAVTEVARLRKAATATAADLSSVRVVLEDGSELPQRGRLLFSDLSVDPTSGQVTLRTEVANPQAQLLPGMYVRTRLVQGQIAGAMLVPQQAVTRGPQGDSVLVVGEGGMAAPRNIKVSGASGSNWIVLDGLKAGEQVIVEGFQKMRPGAPVKPVPWTGAAARPAAPAAASAAASAASR
jgi:membrane fusion protein (multidrug efflux system)